MTTIICYDGSPSAKRAIMVSARTLRAANAVVLHVWTPPADLLADSFSDPGAIGEMVLPGLEVRVRERADEIAEEGQSLAREHGIEATALVERSRSSYWRTILDVAADCDAELIVLGTHGHHAVESALLGSVAGGVTHHSAVPVMIVPAPAVERDLDGSLLTAGRDQPVV